MREISLTSRAAMNAAETGETAVVLVTIEHDNLDEPIRVSSDPTKRLSIAPLKYGTVSNGIEYEFVPMAAVLPDDREGAPIAASLVFDNVDRDMVALARAIDSPASVSMALVLASAPDTVEELYEDLRTLKVSYDADRITLEISRESITSEPWPAHRMTERRFPGLFP